MQNLLKEFRVRNRISQISIAQYLGIAKNTYYQYENGIRKIPLEIVCELANYYDVSVDELLGRTTEPQLLDDARVERPEILELYESLTPELQEHALAYLHGLADRAAIRNVHSVNVTFEDNRRKRQ